MIVTINNDIHTIMFRRQIDKSNAHFKKKAVNELLV